MASPFTRRIERLTVQTAVYWANPSNDGFGGTNYDVPVEIACRWVERPRRTTDDNGLEVVSEAEIMVTQDVEQDGLLFLGELTDLTQSEKDNPEQVEDARKIQSVDKAPLLGSTDDFVRVARL